MSKHTKRTWAIGILKAAADDFEKVAAKAIADETTLARRGWKGRRLRYQKMVAHHQRTISALDEMNLHFAWTGIEDRPEA